MCPLHQKVADIVCKTDRKVICAECVLFDEHKTHTYMKIENFKKEVKDKVQIVQERTRKFTEHPTCAETKAHQSAWSLKIKQRLEQLQ